MKLFNYKLLNFKKKKFSKDTDIEEIEGLEYDSKDELRNSSG